MRFLPTRTPPAIRAAIPLWLDQWEFTHFITLTFNKAFAGDIPAFGSQLKYGRLRSDLRRWNLFVDRDLIGKRGVNYRSDRPFEFFTLEKLDSNPHWHGLVRFMSADETERGRQQREFERIARFRWQQIVPSGTVDVQRIDYQLGVSKYVAKTLGYKLSYEHFIAPDELWNG